MSRNISGKAGFDAVNIVGVDSNSYRAYDTSGIYVILINIKKWMISKGEFI